MSAVCYFTIVFHDPKERVGQLCEALNGGAKAKRETQINKKETHE